MNNRISFFTSHGGYLYLLYTAVKRISVPPNLNKIESLQEFPDMVATISGFWIFLSFGYKRYGRRSFTRGSCASHPCLHNPILFMVKSPYDLLGFMSEEFFLYTIT
jgi:hypothetical protein